jgi:hypothetical protein
MFKAFVSGYRDALTEEQVLAVVSCFNQAILNLKLPFRAAKSCMTKNPNFSMSGLMRASIATGYSLISSTSTNLACINARILILMKVLISTLKL